MANKILEEQRRSREEFLKLKKMQQGEISAGPKPSEIAYKPTTFNEKRKNYWFHYKWHTIGIAATLVVLIILITQCVNRPKYDFSVVYFSYLYSLDNQTELISDYFEKYAKDINGDGKVTVQVLNCSFTDHQNNVQNRNMQLQRLQAYLAGEYSAMLYITDEKSIKYFDNISGDEGLFEGEPLKLSEEFYKVTNSKELGSLPEGLTLSCRRIDDTVLEKNKSAKVTYKESIRIMKELSKASE